MLPRIKIITPKCKINLDIEIMQFSLLAEEPSIHMILYYPKRFYNRETNSAAFYEIQQMSIEPPFLLCNSNI